MRIAIFDLEADGLYHEATKIHCMAIQVIEDDKETNVELFTDIDQAVDVLRSCDLIIAHNGINYDVPVLEKFGYTVDVPIHDTLLISKLACPDLLMKDQNRKSVPPRLKGSHSLKAWGYRLRKLKGDFHEEADWSVYTEAMGEYCKQDVVVTTALYKKLKEYGTPEEAIQLEQDFARIISRQEKHGVYFDVKAAERLHVELIQEAERIEQELYKVFTPLKTWTPKQFPKVPRKKDGTETATLKSQKAMGCHMNEQGEWGYFKEVSFEPTSRQKIARWLQEVYGWKPTDFTEKGNIIINESVLEKLEFPEGKLLAHYFNVKKLMGQLADGNNAWLKLVEDDSRIRGRVDTLGAISRRCTHSKPNLAQVPSVRAYKGDVVRALFTVPKGKKMVGCDMSGLELRVLAHYMARYDKGAYADVILNGDIHTHNQQAAGLPTRDNAKTMIYGICYGAGDAKVGEIVGKGQDEGRKIKDKFFRMIPALKRLTDAVQGAYRENGHLKALDGNPYHIRSSHSALNTLLQGAGALLCKKWMIVTDEELIRSGYIPGRDYEFVLQVHDELAIECNEEIAEDVGRIVQEATTLSGESFNLRIQLDGEYKVGDSWLDIH